MHHRAARAAPTAHNGKADGSVCAGKVYTLFPPVAKVLDARGPGATVARREPFWACFARVRQRLRASPGAHGLEKWLGESAAAPPTRRRRPCTPACLVSRAVSKVF